MRVLLWMALAVLAIGLTPDVAFAADGDSGWGIGIGTGLAIGLAALGCGIGQGLGVNGAVQGIARNPGAAATIQTPMIVGLALIESIALFAFVIAFMLQGKI